MLLIRVALYVIVALLLARAIRGFLGGLSLGLSGRQPPPRRMDRGVRMARDPICGTFVIPGSALAVRDGQGLHHFCSPRCRDAFVAQARRAN